MRTVLIHLRNTDESSVKEFLSKQYPRQQGPPWITTVNGDACLYINLYRTEDMAKEDDLGEPDEVSRLVQAFNGLPLLTLTADVSGRHRGDQEVRHFVNSILGTFDGLAEDEYTQALWTLREITEGREKNGHIFFDWESS